MHDAFGGHDEDRLGFVLHAKRSRTGGLLDLP